MHRFARAERQALSDTFLEVGPEAPTLCGDWTAADLATHLVVRDGRVDLAIGSKVPAIGPLGAVRRYAVGKQREIKRQPWGDLVGRVRTGPPIFTPMTIGPIDEAVNFVEFFIHHEDVLRGAPGFTRRELAADESAALWRALSRGGRWMFRRSTVGVRLASSLGQTTPKGPTSLGSVTLTGEPGELMLAASGRLRVADLALDGSPEAVAAFEASPLGLG